MCPRPSSGPTSPFEWCGVPENKPESTNRVGVTGPRLSSKGSTFGSLFGPSVRRHTGARVPSTGRVTVPGESGGVRQPRHRYTDPVCFHSYSHCVRLLSSPTLKMTLSTSGPDPGVVLAGRVRTKCRPFTTGLKRSRTVWDYRIS